MSSKLLLSLSYLQKDLHYRKKSKPNQRPTNEMYVFFSSPSHCHAVRSGLLCVNGGSLALHRCYQDEYHCSAWFGELFLCKEKNSILPVFSYSSVHSLSCNLPADNENAMICFARTEILPFQGQNAPSYTSLDTALQYSVCSPAFTFQVR